MNDSHWEKVKREAEIGIRKYKKFLRHSQSDAKTCGLRRLNHYHERRDTAIRNLAKRK